MSRIVRRLVCTTGHRVVIDLVWEPRDVWVGAYVKPYSNTARRRCVTIYVCLLPCLPLRISLVLWQTRRAWENRAVTDRYGGKAPSWLRGCFGDCEAMGAIPVFYREGDPDTAPAHGVRHPDVEVETDPVLIALWREAEAGEPADDGWHVVRCPACGGTGRVPWWRTALRLPTTRWLVRGVRVAWRRQHGA